MKQRNLDTPLLFAILALVIFGMIMISSVSVYPSYGATQRLVAKGLLSEPNNYYYLQKSILYVFVALPALYIISKIPFYLLEKYAKQIYITSVILLILVLIIGEKRNGATGWIDIRGINFSLQPVEFAKIGLIIYLSYYLKKKRQFMNDLFEGMFPFFGIVGAIFLLLMLQPDFGSILIITPVVIALYFVGGGNIRYLGVSVLVALVGAIGVYGVGKMTESSDPTKKSGKLTYISKRIDNFLQNNKDAIKDDTINYQTKQGLIAIGSGGFFGLGFGKSIQKFGYLPEVQGDFIFSVIVEELGFMGAFILLFTYMFIAYRGYRISQSIKDPFPRYVAFGITTLIIVQCFVNIGVNLNIVPLTGVTLPFVSYGGSSLLSLMIAVGILLNISRYADKKPKTFTDVLRSHQRVVV